MASIRSQQASKSRESKDKATQTKIDSGTVMGLVEAYALIGENADAILLLQEAVDRLENLLVKEET